MNEQKPINRRGGKFRVSMWHDVSEDDLLALERKARSLSNALTFIRYRRRQNSLPRLDARPTPNKSPTVAQRNMETGSSSGDQNV